MNAQKPRDGSDEGAVSCLHRMREDPLNTFTWILEEKSVCRASTHSYSPHPQHTNTQMLGQSTGAIKA